MMKSIKEIIEDVLNKKGSHIHFIGIGGKGLNGIARYCLEKGYKVSGSDQNRSLELIDLEKMGANIFYNHRKNNITQKVDLIVFSSVIENDNQEIQKAKDLEIPIVKRSLFLGELMKNFQSISIAGSHGKSTTTALVGLALKEAGADPTIFGGALIKEIDSYSRNGNGANCVVEACEYDRSFHNLIGDISIITAVEKSHLEYYLDEKEMLGAFAKFVALHKKDGMIIYNGDDMNIRKVIGNAKCPIFSFGFNVCNDYVIKNIYYKTDSTCFDLYYERKPVVKDVCIKVPGFYNVYNFASAVITLHKLGLNVESIRKVAKDFNGVGRRFEVSEADDQTVFVDDFCHHPTQVKNLFKGIKQFFPDKKVIAIFQPRQYHLIKTFLKEYGESFKEADTVVVTPILPALGDTESDKNSLETSDIINAIKRYSGKKKVFFAKDFKQVLENIYKIKGKRIITTIGAGDIYKVKDMYVKTS